MATEEYSKTLIGSLFQLFQHDEMFMDIAVIDALPLEKQLYILNLSNIDTANSLKLAIYDKVPTLQDSSVDFNRLHHILREFYKEQLLMTAYSSMSWTKRQIPISFFYFVVTQCRRKSRNRIKAQEIKQIVSSLLSFFYYFTRFCIERNCDGQTLSELIMQNPDDSPKRGGWPWKLTELVCNEYGITLGKYARIRKLLPRWYRKMAPPTLPAVTWRQIIDALRHENVALSRVVQSLSLQNEDLGRFEDEESRNLMIKMLGERGLTPPEIEYMTALWERALNQHNVSKMHFDEDENANIDEEWHGLTKNLLRDIYGTHKVFKFGSFKFKDYGRKEFADDIRKSENADKGVFGKEICSEVIAGDSYFNHLDLYPKWLIQDDLFQVMAMQFAVNLLVNEIGCDQIGVGITLYCWVIPQSVVSLYQREVQCTDLLLMKQGERLAISKTDTDTKEIAKNLNLHFQRALEMRDRVISFVVDRRGNSNEQRVYVMTDDRLNLFQCIGLQYRVTMDHEGRGGEIKRVKTWLHYGYNQYTRFWPEHLVWFLPRLFLKNQNQSHKEYLKRIYGNDYRHCFRTRLDDPVFNRYYKILTGLDHVSVNYYRSESNQQRMEYQDYLNQKMNDQMMIHLDSNGYDSDAIFADIAEAVGGDSDDSNLIRMVRKRSASDLESNNIVVALYNFTKKNYSLCTINNVLEIWDCHFVKELIRNLRKFQRENFTIGAANASEFDISATIRGLDHLVTVHNLFSIENKARIRSFVLKQIPCYLGKECLAFSHQCSRRREYGKEHSQESLTMDEVQSLCSVTMDNLSAAHCYLLHSDDVLYRQSGENAKFEVNPFVTNIHEECNEEKKEDDGIERGGVPLSIDWGKHILQWLPFGVHPRFQSFLEEMLMNPESTLNEKILEWFHTECDVKMEEAKTRGVVYTKEELLCLKLYSDTNGLCAAFRHAHWVRTSLDIKRNFYNWGITMYKTFLFHSVPAPSLTLYHGLNQMFTMGNLTPLYNGPFSTTSSWNVAHSFSKGNGLEFTVGVSLVNPLKLVLGIDMQSISCYPNEKEVLLYSQIIPITKTKAFESGDESLIDHLMFSLKEMKDPITNPVAFYRKIGIEFNARWTVSILKHRALFSESRCGGRMVVLRLQDELNLLKDHLNVQHAAIASVKPLMLDSVGKLEVNSTLRARHSKVYIQSTEDIMIRSSAAIINEEANAGNAIFVTSKESFSNNGIISCVAPGRVIIRCGGQFVNTGSIVPVPTITMSDHSSWLDHFMQCLVDLNQEIKNKAEFYNTVGVEYQKEWLLSTLKHHDLFSESQCQRRIVAHRLQHELNILGDRLTVKYEVRRTTAYLEMRSMVSLQINAPLRVHVLKSSVVDQGVVDIECADDIRIESKGNINSNPERASTQSGESNLIQFHEPKGGIIKLISSGGIINGGTLCCDGFPIGGDVDGTAYIHCDGVFINNIAGQIQCGQNGRTLIRCTDFENTGYISSEPMILINSVSDAFTVKQLQFLLFCGEQRFVFNGSAISVHPNLDDDFKWQRADFVFTLSVDAIDSGKKYIFGDIESVRIPIDFPVWNQNGHFMTMRIYVKPKDGSFEYIHCGTVKVTDCIAPYKLEWNEPLLIDDKLSVFSLDSNQHKEDEVIIRCTENIVFGTNGVIETERANGSGKERVSGDITIETAASFYNHGILRNNGLFGDGIVLLAVDGVHNDGIMECSMLRDNDGGGTIVIMTDGEFVNNGVIDCGDDGMVVIQCSEFMNNGSIIPRLTVFIDEEGTAEVVQQRLLSMDNEELIKLTVRNHRGHYNKRDEYHPQNLLKEGTGDRYSSYGCGPPNEDWIVFEHDEESQFIPTTVIICNEYWSAGIKRIAIYGGNNIDDLEEWIEINAIHNEGKYQAVERQIFPIRSRQRWIAYIEQFKYYKLRILENHGSGDWNEFYEFAILGLKLC